MPGRYRDFHDRQRRLARGRSRSSEIIVNRNQRNVVYKEAIIPSVEVIPAQPTLIPTQEPPVAAEPIIPGEEVTAAPTVQEAIPVSPPVAAESAKEQRERLPRGGRQQKIARALLARQEDSEGFVHNSWEAVYEAAYDDLTEEQKQKMWGNFDTTYDNLISKLEKLERTPESEYTRTERELVSSIRAIHPSYVDMPLAVLIDLAVRDDLNAEEEQHPVEETLVEAAPTLPPLVLEPVETIMQPPISVAQVEEQREPPAEVAIPQVAASETKIKRTEISELQDKIARAILDIDPLTGAHRHPTQRSVVLHAYPDTAQDAKRLDPVFDIRRKQVQAVSRKVAERIEQVLTSQAEAGNRMSELVTWLQEHPIYSQITPDMIDPIFRRTIVFNPETGTFTPRQRKEEETKKKSSAMGLLPGVEHSLPVPPVPTEAVAPARTEASARPSLYDIDVNGHEFTLPENGNKFDQRDLWHLSGVFASVDQSTLAQLGIEVLPEEYERMQALHDSFSDDPEFKQAAMEAASEFRQKLVSFVTNKRDVMNSNVENPDVQEVLSYLYKLETPEDVDALLSQVQAPIPS